MLFSPTIYSTTHENTKSKPLLLVDLADDCCCFQSFEYPPHLGPKFGAVPLGFFPLSAAQIPVASAGIGTFARHPEAVFSAQCRLLRN